uniref:Uncharacterized protein n=1 Tax=Anguilla anguilla TaxID=7936 RepID=A0A0E9US33_ANGAN
MTIQYPPRQDALHGLHHFTIGFVNFTQHALHSSKGNVPGPRLGY